MRVKKDLIPVFKKIISKLKIKKIGLIGSVQYVDQFSKIKEYLESEDKEIIIPKKKGFAYYDGQVIGCEFGCCKGIKNEVDGYLVLGNKFHALGAALSVIGKPVYLLDESSNDLVLMDKERDKIIKQRAIVIDKVRKFSKKIGILVDLKPGQYNLDKAERLRKDLEKLGEVKILNLNQ